MVLFFLIDVIGQSWIHKYLSQTKFLHQSCLLFIHLRIRVVLSARESIWELDFLAPFTYQSVSESQFSRIVSHWCEFLVCGCTTLPLLILQYFLVELAQYTMKFRWLCLTALSSSLVTTQLILVSSENVTAVLYLFPDDKNFDQYHTKLEHTY